MGEYISGEIENTRVITGLNKLPALEFLTMGGGGRQNYSQWSKPGWRAKNNIDNFKWLEKKTVFCETWELHEIQIFMSLKFYWNAATLSCMNCLGRFQTPMAELNSCDTHRMTSKLERAVYRLFLKKLVCPWLKICWFGWVEELRN